MSERRPSPDPIRLIAGAHMAAPLLREYAQRTERRASGGAWPGLVARLEPRPRTTWRWAAALAGVVLLSVSWLYGREHGAPGSRGLVPMDPAIRGGAGGTAGASGDEPGRIQRGAGGLFPVSGAGGSPGTGGRARAG